MAKKKKSQTPPAQQQESVSQTTSPIASGSDTLSPTPTRSRGGFKSQELNTIPQGISVVSAGSEGSGTSIDLLSNFISIKKQQTQKPIYSYRVDFEPELESGELKSRLFYRATRELLSKDAIFDHASEARSSIKTREPISHLKVPHPTEQDKMFTITLKLVGTVSAGTFEMLRVYNTHMREFLKELKFCRLGSKGGYVDPSMCKDLTGGQLTTMSGFRTAINMHKREQIFLNLEPNQKFVQKRNLLEIITGIAQSGQQNWQVNVSSELEGKLLITRYDNNIYRIESVNFKLNPLSKFKLDKSNEEISYLDYFKRKNVTIKDTKQPLILVVPNNKRARRADKDYYMIPELCLLTGLTTSQNSDFKLKTEMIKASQIHPTDRVKNMGDFLKKLLSNANIKTKLAAWGYSYDNQPTKVKARLMPMEEVGDGKGLWFSAERLSGSFEKTLMEKKLNTTPVIESLVILVPMNLNRGFGGGHQSGGGFVELKKELMSLLSQGFIRVGLKLRGKEPTIVDLPNDRPETYLKELKKIPSDTTATIVVMNRQQKTTYDAIKKEASVERAMITQVVTAKLMFDSRKANGAAVKIAIQIAAKIGGEPWFLKMPNNKGDMICGYDTYHDTANRGRSFGAFLASMNETQTKWFSRADQHDQKCEISPHMPANVADAMRKYQTLNKNTFPKRVIIYRDGVGDGQLEEVHKTEVQQVLKAIKKVNSDTMLTFVVVNKRIGARFYSINAKDTYGNPAPGSVVDNLVTRSARFDFYLISQHTRFGTVTPTYYNIIFDQSKTSPAEHQTLAYKLCFLYYNWAGTVRVPAPCQYAHKLALLCGEHLHRVPNEKLGDRLHFL